jgi:hypothetical protein
VPAVPAEPDDENEPARLAVSVPLASRPQAQNLPAVRAIYDEMHASDRRGIMGQRSYQMMREACAAGVQVGAFDDQILRWLAGSEPEACAAITRAAAARSSLGPDAGAVIGDADLATMRAALADAIAWRQHTSSRSRINAYYALQQVLGGGR